MRLTAEANLAARSSYNFTVHVQESNGEQVSKDVTLVRRERPQPAALCGRRKWPNNYAVRSHAARPRAVSGDDERQSGQRRPALGPDQRQHLAVTDKDFFSITLNAGEQIILDIDGTTTLDSLVRLFDAEWQ